jgi:hypothetical protein
MEETDVCHSIPAVRALQQAIPNYCHAKTLGPGERISLGVQALAGHQTITGLADDAGVSRKFIYQQRDRAQTALDDAVSALPYADRCGLFDFIVGPTWLAPQSLRPWKIPQGRTVTPYSPEGAR